MYIYLWKLIVSFQGIVYSFSFQFYSVKLVLFHTEFMCNFPTHSPIQFHWFFFQAHSVHSPHALVCSVVTPKSFRWSRFSVVPRSAVHTSILVHDTRRRHLLQQESHTYTLHVIIFCSKNLYLTHTAYPCIISTSCISQIGHSEPVCSFSS